MKVAYDAEVDALYVHFIDDGIVTRTVEAHDDCHLDYDALGLLVGIEILGAHEVVSAGMQS